jgi:drug/metabolite transporter (DMT)-like permease
MTFVVATASWLVGLQRVDLSYAYPLVSLGYVLVAVLAIVFFHERIDYTRWTAIAVLSVGVILIASS